MATIADYLDDETRRRLAERNIKLAKATPTYKKYKARQRSATQALLARKYGKE